MKAYAAIILLFVQSCRNTLELVMVRLPFIAIDCHSEMATESCHQPNLTKYLCHEETERSREVILAMKALSPPHSTLCTKLKTVFQQYSENFPSES